MKKYCTLILFVSLVAMASSFCMDPSRRSVMDSVFTRSPFVSGMALGSSAVVAGNGLLGRLPEVQVTLAAVSLAYVFSQLPEYVHELEGLNSRQQELVRQRFKTYFGLGVLVSAGAAVSLDACSI